jgi:Flp pilus assembly protein TadD
LLNKLAMSLGLLALLPADPAAAAPQRFRPMDENFLVLRLTNDPLQTPAREVRDSQTAERVATRYLALAASTRDQRYYGRAEAAIRPWLERADVSPAVLQLQAGILQNRHEFGPAIQLLSQAIMLAPGDAQARLSRATVLMVQGDAAKARADCSALFDLGQSPIAAVCLAQTLGATGQLERATETIELLLRRDALPTPSLRAWALGSLADFSSRRSDMAAAERYWREALALTPWEESIRCNLGDIMIARGAAREALALLDLPQPSVGMLVRRALAQAQLGEKVEHRNTTERIDQRLRLELQRGERVHLREEALLALGTGKPPHETLSLAKANFAVQREAIDVRLFARAASRARDAAALEQIHDWVRQTGFKDRLVQQLLDGARI